MPVKITRYGGPMVTKPKVTSFALKDLDLSTQTALENMLNTPSSVASPKQTPDGFVYSFEVSGINEPTKQLEVSGSKVPEQLRKLLP